MSATVVSDRAMRVYRDACVIDMHNDMPSRILDDGYDPDVRHEAGFGKTRGHTDLPRLVESGLTAQFMAAWVDAPYAATPGASFARALRCIDEIHAFVRRHPERLRFATTGADVVLAKREQRIAVFVGVEGGHAIESSLDRLRDLYARGARYLTLTWNNGVEWAGSSLGDGGTHTGGLSAFGREVVREMETLGMLVDVSHVSDRTFFDVLDHSTQPVIASHSSARALNDSPRNLSDEQLRALAQNGGVANVNFFSRFLDSAYRRQIENVEATVAAARRDSAAVGGDARATTARIDAMRDALVAAIPPTPFQVLVDHIDHVATVAGIDHVGLGSDFDGVTALPVGMEDVTCLPRIVQALIDRGYADENVRKVLGENMRRVMTRTLPSRGQTR